MRIIKEHSLSILSFGATLVLTLIAEFILSLSREGTYLTFAVGVTVTLAVSLLEKEIKRSIEFYRRIAEIDDKELQTNIIEIVESISNGEIPPELASLRSRRIIKKTQKHLEVSDYQVKNTLEGILKWEDDVSRKTWYDDTLEAIKRGVMIERHFILRRNEVLKNGSWDERALSILQKQSSDGIHVRILWIEDIEDRHPIRDLLQDFAIFDKKEILLETQFNRRWMYRTPSSKVKLYQEIFEEQKKFSLHLKEIVKEESD